MSKLVLVLDSTQIQAFTECPRLWHYDHVLRLVAEGTKARRRVMDMGSFGHHLLEIFYYTLAETGGDRKRSVEKALSFKPSEFCECGHVKELHAPVSLDPVLSDGTGCKHHNCIGKCLEFKEIEPAVSPKDQGKVRNRLVQYWGTYTNNDIVPFSKETVELGFSYKLFESVDRLYILEGKIDLTGRYGGSNSFTDHKFQERKKNLHEFRIQFKNYFLVTGFHTAFINYIRLAEEISPDTFKRVVLTFNEAQRNTWKRRLTSIYDRVATLLARSDEPGFWTSEESNPNWGRCEGKYGYPCDFSRLCEELDPAVVERAKNALYYIRPPWSPWDIK